MAPLCSEIDRHFERGLKDVLARLLHSGATPNAPPTVAS
jgi:hypothetical protein